MDLLCIADAVKQFGISSKTLRYYESIDLIKPIRMESSKYRYYDNENVERIKQILVLRKMQISMKDIIRIYESEDMSTVVDVFIDRINAIDEQMGTLSELKNIINEFLQTMTQNGITKISAIPLLYEEMDKQLEVLEERKPVTYRGLSEISEKLATTPEVRIISLPSKRFITSYDISEESFIDEFWTWVHTTGLSPGSPGSHGQFEYQDEKNQSVIMLEIPDTFTNTSNFQVKVFDGGLFAVASVYTDDDLVVFNQQMVHSFDGNRFYEIDYTHDGKQRHETLIETLMSPDSTRELSDIFIPVKRRMPDAMPFSKLLQTQNIENVTIEELELANPVLWKVDVPLDKLMPIYNIEHENLHYAVLPSGEVEFTPYASTRSLSTDIPVRLPFRFDIDFKTDSHYLRLCHDNTQFIVNGGYKTDPKLARGAMEFMQPIFNEWHRMNEAGKIILNEYNRVSWIIGEKHIALIINGEVRYCGIDFPYMLSDFGLLPTHPIVIGSNGNTLLIRSITISQLKYIPKIKIKKENFNMITKQSNNLLPNIRVICRGDRGENHDFCGIAAYVMECIGEKGLGEFKDDINEVLWFFEGLTADVLAQVYSYVGYQGWARSEYLFSKEFTRDIFYKCGYASTFITPEEFNSNKEMYIQTVMAYIDKGTPVIIRQYPHGDCKAVCGYEDYGKTLLYLDGSNHKDIQKLSIDGNINFSWVFVGEKKRSINIAEMYRDMILNLPDIFEEKTDRYCFGTNAFAAWAESIEHNSFTPDTVYVCVLATNSGGSSHILDKAIELNPDMGWVNDVKACYSKTGDLWNDIEKLGMGFGITQAALDDDEKRDVFAKLVRQAEQLMSKATDIIKSNR